VLLNGKKTGVENLAPGMRVRLQMSAVKPQVIDLRAEGLRVDVLIRAVDATRRTITVRLTDLGMLVERLPVAADATIRLGKDEVALADLKPGTAVALRMDAHRDKSVVVGIEGNAKQ
jgi:hypothetical protein